MDCRNQDSRDWRIDGIGAVENPDTQHSKNYATTAFRPWYGAT